MPVVFLDLHAMLFYSHFLLIEHTITVYGISATGMLCSEAHCHA